MSDVDDQKVTDEEIVTAASSFLTGVPLLEFEEVHEQVKNLISDKKLLEDAMKAVPARYESCNAPIATDKDPPFVLVNAAGKVGEGEYACPTSSLAYTVDWVKQKGTDSRDLSDAEKAAIGVDDETRLALDKAIAKYLAEHHEKGGNHAVFKKGDEYIICVQSALANKKSMWTGTYTTTATLSGGDLAFKTKVQVHYWEDGNVQLNSNWQGKATVKEGKSLATDVAKELTKHVNLYHNRVNMDFATMSSGTLKSLRRVLPITKQKIKWEKIETYKLAKENS